MVDVAAKMLAFDGKSGKRQNPRFTYPHDIS
jgi:hypothetical protein